MKRSIFIALSLAMAAGASAKWLPEKPVGCDGIRVLDCAYDREKLVSAVSAGESGRWNVSVSADTVADGIAYRFTFVAAKPMESSGVAVAFDRAPWSSDNYVMIPASVYGGNRQRIVNRGYATGLDPSDYRNPELALTSNPIPQLSPDFGAPSMVEVSVCNAATPAIVVHDRQARRGHIFLTDQGITHADSIRDHSLTVEEAPDRSMASIVIGAPGVRERKAQFIGFTESPDRGMSFSPGDSVVVNVTHLSFPAPEGVTATLDRFMSARKMVAHGREPRNLMPMSHVGEIMNRNIDGRYMVASDSVEFYRPEEADWMAYGWIGGLINTYPMLALGDAEHRRKVAATFDFALPRAKGASGYYYDVLLPDGTVKNRDAAAVVPGIGLTRRNGDVLYWMIKHFDLMKQQGHADEIKPEWEDAVKRLADAFVNTWNLRGTWGNYIDVESGDVAVYRTSGGASAVGGLALAARYFDNPVYLDIARRAAASLYGEFATVGFTSGGCGDILQNSDSETAIALCTSLVTLYETTGDKVYLDQAADLANLCATWTVSWDYILPPATPLARLGANLTGAVWASTQNKHGAPGFCTLSGDALFKIYRATGDRRYAELLRDIIHAHAEGIQPNGRISERLTYCDADNRGSRADGWLTGWNETNGALMAIEIPGIYADTASGEVYTFDAVETTVLSHDAKGLQLAITNPTVYPATVTILADTPAGEARHTVSIKPGKTVKCRI